MKEYQNINQKLVELDLIDRPEKQKEHSLTIIKENINKKPFTDKPVLVSVATIAAILLFSILSISFIKNEVQDKNVFTPGESEIVVEGEEDTSKDDKSDSSEKVINLPESITLTYTPIHFVEFSSFNNNNHWEWMEEEVIGQIEDSAITLNYYYDEELSSIRGSIQYEGKEYDLDYLAISDTTEDIRKFLVNTTYSLDDGIIHFIGAVGSFSLGYEYIFFDTRSKTFNGIHSTGYPNVKDLNNDGLEEIVVQSEGKGLTPADVQIFKFNGIGLEKASINAAINNDHEGVNPFIHSLLLEDGTVGVFINGEEEELKTLFEIIDDKQLENVYLNKTEEEYREIAKSLWQYELSINEKRVPINGLTELEESEVTISLVEVQPPYVLIPTNIFYAEQLDNYNDQIINFNVQPDEKYGTDGTIVTGTHYKFSNLKKGSIITFHITEELKERLGLETKEIHIRRK